MIEVKEILALYQERKMHLGPLHLRAMEIRAAYYNEVRNQFPALDRSDKPLVANLVMQGVEQKAMRVASTMPSIYFPPLRPGIKISQEKARMRGDVIRAWHNKSKMQRQMKQRARHVVAYATSPVLVRPDLKRQMPRWYVRDPFDTFPAPMPLDEICPTDCIFTFTRGIGWLQRNYPAQAAMLNKGVNDSYICLEYVDDKEYVLSVVGESFSPDHSGRDPMGHTPAGEIVELERIQNRAGYPLAVVPNKVSLDSPVGEFNSMAGLLQQKAQLFGLEVIGMQRTIFPEEWLVDNPNGETARIVTHADPMHGITGHVTGGDLKIVRPEPSQFGLQMGDRLEREARVDSGTPAQLGGEAASNIRTGRRGDQVLSAVLDFPIQDAQELFAMSMEEENRIAIEIDKAYFSRSKSVYISATAGEITYTAPDLWETSEHTVRYAHAGVDQQGLVVEGGQRVAMGTMSKRSFMEIDPVVEDPESELDRVASERLDDALLTAIGTLAQDPMHAEWVARAAAAIRTDKLEIEGAILEIAKQVKEEQAAQAAPQPGGAPADPNAQPGLANPAIQPPQPSLQNLRDTLQTLHMGSAA